LLGDLRGLVEGVRTPLAIRSSSLLEDALQHPFAGVYATKMIPNNLPSADDRFRQMVEAIKFVYASTFFRASRDYIRATARSATDEKMAVVIQEVVGDRHGDRYYPDISGVARSYNFYPTGRARPEEGVVNLALGLGKTIVDGGINWAYSPAHPKAPPPFGSTRELLSHTQTRFWAVNMGRPPEYDPTAETEYLVLSDLTAADYDGTLGRIASTYDPRSDRLVPGTGPDGPRVLNFAPLLVLGDLPFNDLLRRLLAICEDALDAEVEIEFAAVLPRASGEKVRFGFLQVRPMAVSVEPVEIGEHEWNDAGLVVASSRTMGNGTLDSIRDIVYVKPEPFEARHTRSVADEVARLNDALVDAGRPYLLIGFGRWGSSDPWLGIPVDWGQICGAKAIIEATRPEMDVEASQGSHFFHNITSFQVRYLTVHHEDRPGIDWTWLAEQPVEQELEFTRHVKTSQPLTLKVDGRTGRGGVWRQAETAP
jgi:hypothetical protein